MSLEKATIPMSAQQIKNFVLNDKVNFDHWVQRKFEWNNIKKSDLIDSMMRNFPIPPVFAKRDENKVYIVLDGKQRMSTIKSYLNDEFKLAPLKPITYRDEEENKEVTIDVSGKSFSELPEGLQNHLKTTSITMIYFDNMTDDEQRECFKRLNSGKSLSTKSKLLASCNDITNILDIGSHRLFDEMLTAGAKANKNQVTLIFKAYLMMTDDIDYITFESKIFNPIVEEAQITEEEKEAMIKVFDLMAGTHDVLIGQKEKKVAKKLYTETHMVSLVPFFQKAIEEEYDAEQMADWLMAFFGTTEGATVSERYNNAITNGSAKNTNIVVRHEELTESFEQFFESLQEDVEEALLMENISNIELEEIDSEEVVEALEQSEE